MMEKEEGFRMGHWAAAEGWFKIPGAGNPAPGILSGTSVAACV
jgi:hypothetical protein